MYILSKAELQVQDLNYEVNVSYRLEYKIDKFGNYDNHKIYIVNHEASEPISTKITEQELLDKYFS